MAIYLENQIPEQRKEEFRLFLLAVPEFYNIPENRAVIEEYLSTNDLPYLKDRWCAGYLLNRKRLLTKDQRFRPDDLNGPSKSGRLSVADREAENRKIQQAKDERVAAINSATKRRERKEAEIRIGQYQEYRLGKVDHAATQMARQRMLAELDKSNPKETLC